MVTLRLPLVMADRVWLLLAAAVLPCAILSSAGESGPLHLRGTFGISSLALDAKLVPLYRYMAQTADREAGIATPPSSNHRYSTAAAKGSNASSSIVKRGRPLTYSKTKKDTPENNLIQELVKRYGEARKVSDGRVPNGFFEAMVNATKKDMQLETLDLGSMVDLNKKIRPWSS